MQKQAVSAWRDGSVVDISSLAALQRVVVEICFQAPTSTPRTPIPGDLMSSYVCAQAYTHTPKS